MGIKDLASYWEPADRHGEWGILLDFRPKNWPVNIALDFLKSDGDDTDSWPFFHSTEIEGKTTEINIGIRKIIENRPAIRPYIGGGLAYINGEYRKTINWFSGGTSILIGEDDGIGIWIDAGLYFTLAKHFNIGFDIRYSWAEITISGVDVNAGGLHAGLIFGFHW